MKKIKAIMPKSYESSYKLDESSDVEMADLEGGKKKKKKKLKSIRVIKSGESEPTVIDKKAIRSEQEKKTNEMVKELMGKERMKGKKKIKKIIKGY